MNISRKILIGLFFLYFTQLTFCQTILTGFVKDFNTGEPLVGANVNIVNKNNRSIGGTLVDPNGEFHIQISQHANVSIIVSFIGYKSQSFIYTGQKTLDVRLQEDAQTIEAVEVVAKKITKNQEGMTKKDMVSASQKVTLEGLETAPVASITEALQGAMANVDIITGADPGSKSSIRIRGTTSLNASSDPLIVVDGVPFPVTTSSDFSFATANADDYGTLLNISPADIESIEVLKDAAATSVWGSRGANGVLLIETKKGAKGRIQFSFNTKYELQKQASTIPLLNANQYVALVQDELWNTIGDAGFSNSSSYYSLLFNTKEINFDPSYTYFNEYNQNTNWVKEVTQTGFTSDNTFSISGGGDKANYRLSLGYLNQKGTTVGTAFKRFSTMFTMQYKFSNKLDLTTEYSFSDGTTDTNWSNPRSEALTKMPNMSPYYIASDGSRTSQYFTPYSNFQGTFDVDSDGDVDGPFNPVAMAKEAVDRTNTITNRVIFNLHYRLMNGLNWYSIVGLNTKSANTKKFLPQSVTGLNAGDAYYNRSQNATSDQTYLTTENRFIYNWEPSKIHKFIISGIVQTSEQSDAAFSEDVSGSSTSGLSDPTTSGTIQALNSNETLQRTFGTIGNFHYTLFGRYMVDLGYREEANSSIGANNRWGGFPTIGLAWQLGDESFIKKLETISTAKVRLSWGQSGNSPSGASPYVGTFTPTTQYMDYSAVQPSSIQLNNLKWETVSQYNAGLDLGLFEDKLACTFDVYDKTTSNLLQKSVSTPTTTGYSSVRYINSGEMTNKGWEVSFNWKAIDTKKFGAIFSLNVAQNINKIVNLPVNIMDQSYTFANGNYANKVVPGDPLGSFYGYNYLGVYKNLADTYARDANGNVMKDISGNPVIIKNGNTQVKPGDAKYRDLNHDGVINQYDITYLGNAMPTLTGSFGINLRYKEWGLIANFYGRAGQKIINSARMSLENMYGSDNQSTAVLRRWRREGDDTDIPRALYGRGYNYLGSDRFVEDGSFLRLKTLTVKYSVPRKALQLIGLTQCDIYATAYDLWTLTNYSGQDPEVSLSTSVYMLAKDTATTPKPIRVAMGLNLRF